MIGADIPPQLRRWTTFWRREVLRHLPQGFQMRGVVGGGTGTSFPAVLAIIASIMSVVILLSLVAASQLHWQRSTLVLILGLTGAALPSLLAEIGVYRPMLLAWSPDRLVVVERAGLDRLVSMRAYALPLPGGIHWASAACVEFGSESIFVHRPRWTRPLLEAALGGDASENAGVAPFEDFTMKAPTSGWWHLVHVLGVLLLSVTLILPAVCGFAAISWPESWPLPLSAPTAIAASSDGRIAVLQGLYGRVQIYDGDGNFVRGIGVRSRGGAARIAVDRADRLWVYCRRDYSMRRFSFEGEITGAWSYLTEASLHRIRLLEGGDPHVDRGSQWMPATESRAVSYGDLIFVADAASADFRDSAGNRYAVAHPFWISIATRSDGPSPRLRLWGPWWMLPVGFPLPGVPLGLILAFVGYRRSRPIRLTDQADRSG